MPVPSCSLTIGAELAIEALRLPAEGYSHLTYPRCRRWLTEEVPAAEGPRELVAIAARSGDFPIGLALLVQEGQAGRWRLWSVAVAPPWRQQGIGLRLMQACEPAARAHGAQTLLAYHSSRMPGLAAFRALLDRAEWSPPDPVEHRLSGRADWVFQAEADWRKLLDRVRRRGHGATPWAELTAEDRLQVEAIVARGLPLPALDPFRWEGAAEPAVSVAVRQHGRVVGWVMGTRELEAGAIHYTAGYVVPELQRAGWLIVGCLEVCRRQMEAFGPESVAVLTTWAANRPMIRFMRERLGVGRRLWTDDRYVSRRALPDAD